MQWIFISELNLILEYGYFSSYKVYSLNLLSNKEILLIKKNQLQLSKTKEDSVISLHKKSNLQSNQILPKLNKLLITIYHKSSNNLSKSFPTISNYNSNISNKSQAIVKIKTLLHQKINSHKNPFLNMLNLWLK